MAAYREVTPERIADSMRNAAALEISVCVLAGAGVSVSSGIPDSAGIMEDIRQRYPHAVKARQPSSYSDYMSLLTEGERRQLIRGYISRARLNKASSAIARLASEGLVDRILTTNFDPLLERALAVYGCEPTVHDFALAQAFVRGWAKGLHLFYLHGRADGFMLLNTEEEVNSLSNRLDAVFSDSNVKRMWIVIGYSGLDRPVFGALSSLERYEFGLYWVGYGGQDPAPDVIERVLSKADACYVRAEDADSFFEQLLQDLGLDLANTFRPKIPVPLGTIDEQLTRAGILEAADIFGIRPGDVSVLAFRVLNEQSGVSHLHRVFVRRADLSLIADELDESPTANVIRTLIRKKGLSLHVRKSHRLIPTRVDGDAAALGKSSETPALVHAQISYAETARSTRSSDKRALDLEPVELLLTKYVTPLSVCGYLLDRKPRSGYEFSKVAEDLFSRERYAREVVSSVETFFYPFSYLGAYLSSHGTAYENSIPSSEKPEKLLRIMLVPTDRCNYDCTFCCQTRTKTLIGHPPVPSPDLCEILARAAVASGCRRVMLTGGEPLLSPRDQLLEIVKRITSIDGIEDFWICTNGSLLDARFSESLRDNGLEKLVVSIGANTPTKYREYTRQGETTFEAILDNVCAARAAGLRVKIDIPLNRPGISNYVELLDLVEILREADVREGAYFQLHKTVHNSEVFEELFVPHKPVTWELAQDSDWRIIRKRSGQRVFSDGDFEMIIPARIFHETDNCAALKCGPFCQGIYAAYARVDGENLVLQGCHRQLPENTFRLPEAAVQHPSVEELAELFSFRVWKWAYER